MKLHLVEHSSRQFTYNAATKTMIGDASTMMNRHLERIYDDACDVGFLVRSETTGAVITFVMSTPMYHGQGEDEELCGWKYEPCFDSVRKYPACAGMTAEIFNT